MKKFLNILITVSFLFILVNCSIFKHSKKENKDEILGASIKYELCIENASTYQIDSLIIADTLPSLNFWYASVFVDYQTNEKVVKRMYIKAYDKQKEITYIIQGTKEPFYLEKRIRK